MEGKTIEPNGEKIVESHHIENKDGEKVNQHIKLENPIVVLPEQNALIVHEQYVYTHHTQGEFVCCCEIF